MKRVSIGHVPYLGCVHTHGLADIKADSLGVFYPGAECPADVGIEQLSFAMRMAHSSGDGERKDAQGLREKSITLLRSFPVDVANDSAPMCATRPVY